MAATTIYATATKLYSADLNQTSLHRFSSSGTRDAFFTSPVAGNVCYVIGTGLQMYSGSAWVTAITTAGLPTSDVLKAPLAAPAFTGTLTIGGDVNLYRSAANQLKTDDTLVAALDFQEYGNAYLNYDNVSKTYFGSAADTNLYRSAANILKTDDAFVSTGSYVDGTRFIARVGGGGTYAFNHDSDGNGWTLWSNLTGAANAWFAMTATGVMNWGAGGATATDTNLYRSAANVLKSDDKVVAALGIGVGNSAAATTLGTLSKKMEVFDASGASLGFVPIYTTIT